MDIETCEITLMTYWLVLVIADLDGGAIRWLCYVDEHIMCRKAGLVETGITIILNFIGFYSKTSQTSNLPIRIVGTFEEHEMLWYVISTHIIILILETPIVFDNYIGGGISCEIRFIFCGISKAPMETTWKLNGTRLFSTPSWNFLFPKNSKSPPEMGKIA